MELGKIRNLIDLDEFFIYEFFGLLPLSLFFSCCFNSKLLFRFFRTVD